MCKRGSIAHRLTCGHRLHLTLKLLQAGHTRTRCCLIGRDHHALETRLLMQRPGRHKTNNRGTVGIGDNTFVVFSICCINLRDNQWHISIHTESMAIINAHSTAFYRLRQQFARDIITCSSQHNIDTLKGFRSRENGWDLLVMKYYRTPHRTRTRKGHQATNGKISLFQTLQHLCAHNTCGTQNGNSFSAHTHNSRLNFFMRSKAVVHHANCTLKIIVVHTDNNRNLL